MDFGSAVRCLLVHPALDRDAIGFGCVHARRDPELDLREHRPPPAVAVHSERALRICSTRVERRAPQAAGRSQVSELVIRQSELDRSLPRLTKQTGFALEELERATADLPRLAMATCATEGAAQRKHGAREP